MRSPNAPLIICSDHKKMIENNSLLFKAWFKAWIISFVPLLIDRPKWHNAKGEANIGTNVERYVDYIKVNLVLLGRLTWNIRIPMKELGG